MALLGMEYEDGPIIISSGSLYNILKPGIYYLTSGVSDTPSGGGVYIVGKYNDVTVAGIFIDEYDRHVYAVRNNGGTWSTEEITNPDRITISGTTSGTGALAIPSTVIGKFFVSAQLTSNGPGYAFRRDDNYLTVFNYDMTIKGNTAVTVSALFI
jgi:hypothetical protein